MVVMRLVLVMSLFGLTSSLVAVTEQVQAKDKGRFAVIDMQSVILNVEEGKAARAELEGEIKKKEAEFVKQKAELDKMNEEWKGQAAVLSESARMKKQQEFQEKFLELRNAEMTFQQEIKRREQKATQKIAMGVAKLVEDISKAQGFEAVFETNSAGLLYLKDPVDLTKEVIAAYAKQGGSKTAKQEEKK